jgi:hypothetical protein
MADGASATALAGGLSICEGATPLGGYLKKGCVYRVVYSNNSTACS